MRIRFFIKQQILGVLKVHFYEHFRKCFYFHVTYLGTANNGIYNNYEVSKTVVSDHLNEVAEFDENLENLFYLKTIPMLYIYMMG